MRIGAKNGIYLALSVYAVISMLGYFMSEPWHFWALAVALSFVQGGSQALSRSVFATMVPAGKSSQFFGFYSISGKFGNIIGPLVFALVADLMGSSRFAILALVVFFVVGMVLLSQVDLAEAGRRHAVPTEENERNAYPPATVDSSLSLLRRLRLPPPSSSGTDQFACGCLLRTNQCHRRRP